VCTGSIIIAIIIRFIKPLMKYIIMVELVSMEPKDLLERLRAAEQSLEKIAIASGEIPVSKLRVFKQGERSYVDLTPYGIKPGTILLGVKIRDVFIFIVQENE
jgi:hypothetical protein